jgi:hypothetical protein
MNRLVFAFALVCQMTVACVGNAASISGIVLYASDYSGIPNGIEETTQGNLRAQLWRSALGGAWFGLGVWQGLPPESLRVAPLSAPNFNVEIPLTEGENLFTLMGEPGLDDAYDKYAINLYFDGAINGPPGISVLIDRYAPPGGGAPTPNRPDYLYSLLLEHQPGATPQTYYDDGLERVTITAASFLPQPRFNPDWSFDLLSSNRFDSRGNGTKDYIGVLKVMVEPSIDDGTGNANPGGGGARPVAPSGTGFGGGVGGGGGYGGDPGYGNAGIPAGGGVPSGANAPAYQQPRRETQQAAAHPTPPAQRAEPTADATDATPEATEAATTPSAATTRTVTTPTPPHGTVTPKTTAAAGTPTKAPASKSPAAGTPTAKAPVARAPVAQAPAAQHALATPTPGKPHRSEP